ncbi:MAG: SelT/SelW/SelH family protein [Anaerolineae bacterium]|nr:MAG: SelT/SelW/SelH family protein [Anaerolineae bacterium]
MSLASDLLKNFEPQIESLTLVPSDGGRFEVSVNGNLLYSKLQTGRHAEPGEVVRLVRNFIERGE